MSRSYRKNPYVPSCCCKSATLKFFKTQMNASTRNWLDTMDSIPKGSYYKKLMYDYCWRPDDGKTYWDNPRAYRK